MVPPARRPAPKSTPRKSASNHSKKDAKPNASILTFFKKVETEKGLFYSSSNSGTKDPDEDFKIADVDEEIGDDDRFEESETSAKRRKLGPDPDGGDGNNEHVLFSDCIPGSTPSKPEPPLHIRTEAPTNGGPAASIKMVGGFILDEESDDEDIEDICPVLPEKPVVNHASSDREHSMDEDRASVFKPKEQDPVENGERDTLPNGMDCVDYIDDADIADGFMGEEYREMLFSQVQARLEAGDSGDFNPDDFPQLGPVDDVGENCCPICGGSLAGATSEESTRHVNSCLDGNPIRLPSRPGPKADKTDQAPEERGRAAKAAIPRPAQANPFSIRNGDSDKSAFAKLMSGNAEKSAWTTAAAAENAARGKPAYQRTCPFYKIMPGFSICVDAFRYGAVKDCNAYFLSHFHSDHYIGLTANWKHGPIYCSRVTGRLVKQQLRVDAKWIVELDFDAKFDIPGTEGAWVTMIPANHCPGSSLFLFEKRMGKGPNARLQRILHCGDFRACYAHITHDLLKPNILDPVSKRVRQQKIDICYLDTTYLNPRYNFPPQEHVIHACASLCLRISEDEAAWDRLGAENGTLSVSKLFKKPNKVPKSKAPSRNRLLVVCGTYSIGKERICVAIAKALKTKIYATRAKLRICKMLDDPEFLELLTSDPREAQVHMQSLGEIRAETLREYLEVYKPHFNRIVGFRPSGWNYKPRGAFFGRLATSNTQPSAIPTSQLLRMKWCPEFGVEDFERQRGSTSEAMCFGVPYSEHSSFRELCLFLMTLRIERVIPTVNVGSEHSRSKMKGWIDKWIADRAKGGLVQARGALEPPDAPLIQLWDGRGQNREAWW